MQRLPQTIYRQRRQAQRIAGLVLWVGWMGLRGLYAQNDYLLEDFEGDFPVAWTVQPALTATGFEGWVHRSARQTASPYFPVTGTSKIVALNDDACGQTGCAFADARLITPSVALPPGKPAYLVFDIFYRAGAYQSTREQADVLVSVNGGSFIPIAGLGNLSGKNAWRTLRANLSGYAGNSVQIMFRYSDGGGWADGIALDNIRIYTPPPYDLELFFFNLSQEEYLAQGSYRISGGVVNKGTQTVGGMVVRWSLDGDEYRPAALTGISLAPFDTIFWEHPETLSLAAAGKRHLAVEALIDGVDDPTPQNNVAVHAVYVLDSVPYKTALMEMFTSNTCGLCPFAHFWADTLAKYYPSTIVVAHHLESSGPSALDIPEAAQTYFGLNQSYMPALVFNRTRLPLQSTLEPQSDNGALDARLWEEAVFYTLNRPSPLSAEFSAVQYDSLTGKYTLTVESRAFAPVETGLRLNVMVVEDQVRGVGPEYDQANALNDNAAFPMYYQKGNPIRNYVHGRVLRAVLGGPWGVPVADSAAVGQKFSLTFEYVPPAGIKRQNLSFVALVQEYDTNDVFRRRVFNAREARVVGDTFVTARSTPPRASILTYPNPFDDRLYVQSALPVKRATIRAADGRLVAGTTAIPDGGWDVSFLTPGAYFIEIQTRDDRVHRQKIVKR